MQPRCPGPTDQLSPASWRPHRCSAHQHGTDGGHGMGHLPQDSQTRYRHSEPVRAQRGTPAPAPHARAQHNEARPHLQSCGRGVDGPGAGDDGPPAAGEGTMLPAHQLQGELAISVPRHRHPRATITAGKGWGICRFTHTSQACRARPRTTRHAPPNPESSLRGHQSQNRVGSDVASPAMVRPWGRWPGSR